MFSKKKKASGAPSKRVTHNADAGMTAIQEFLNRGPGTMKQRGGKSNAHILSDQDGEVAEALKLHTMRLKAAEKRFQGFNQYWTDSNRKPIVKVRQFEYCPRCYTSDHCGWPCDWMSNVAELHSDVTSKQG